MPARPPSSRGPLPRGAGVSARRTRVFRHGIDTPPSTRIVATPANSYKSDIRAPPGRGRGAWRRSRFCHTERAAKDILGSCRFRLARTLEASVSGQRALASDGPWRPAFIGSPRFLAGIGSGLMGKRKSLWSILLCLAILVGVGPRPEEYRKGQPEYHGRGAPAKDEPCNGCRGPSWPRSAPRPEVSIKPSESSCLGAAKQVPVFNQWRYIRNGRRT